MGQQNPDPNERPIPNDFVRHGRYQTREALPSGEGRLTWSALDRLRGVEVVRKSGPTEQVVAEARALLHAPPGVAPKLVDFEFLDSDRASITMERLAGKTLLQAPTPVSMAGPLALAISECLAHFHRLGLAHCDVKPSNILLEEPFEAGAMARVRLLDLGHTFAFERGGWDERPLGGSPGYVAPEIVRGWRVDGRADQFSLAVTLLDLFPVLRHDPVWSPLLGRLGSPMPSRRFKTILEFARELASALSLPAPEARPRMGGGPLRGRDTLQAALLAAAHRLEERRSSGQLAAVLVHGAPHSGLSRGLLEGLIATPEVRWAAVDLSEIVAPIPAGADTAHPLLLPSLLDEMTESGARLLLLAIDEPGPEQATARVLDRLGHAAASGCILERVFLDRLSGSDFAEVVATSLGHDGPDTMQVAAALHERCEGELRLSANEFTRIVDAGASDGALGWVPPSEYRCAAPPPEPSFESAGAGTQHLLALLARAGEAPPADLAQRFLAEFCSPSSFGALTNAGWARVGEDRRLQWISARAHQAAFASPPPNVDDLDRWLAAHLRPDIQRPREIRECVARLHRLGQTDQLRELLNDYLERAVVRREVAVLRALLQPLERTWSWTFETLTGRSRELADLLGPSWPAPRIGLEIARYLAADQDPAAHDLLRRLAEDLSTPWGVEALLDYAISLRGRHMSEPLRTTWEKIEELTREGRGPDRGRFEFERARQLAADGNVTGACAAAEFAYHEHQGTGSNTEVNALAFLGYLAMPDRPQVAAGYLERASRCAASNHSRLIMMLGLSQVLEASGELRRADEALRSALGLMSSETPAHWQFRCWVQLSWIAVLLGHGREASPLVRRLANAMAVRKDRNWHPAVRVSAAMLGLYSGDRPRAVAAAVQACELLERDSEVQVRTLALRCALDVFLDLGLLSEIAAFGSSIGPLLDGCSRYSPALEPRWSAAVAHANGDAQAASALLEAHGDSLGGTFDALELGRFHHHRGLLLRHLGRLETAAQEFQHAIECLAPPGCSYFVARSQLLLADCLWRTDAPDRAREVLAQSLHAGRSGRFPSLVADGLRLSALWQSNKR